MKTAGPVLRVLLREVSVRAKLHYATQPGDVGHHTWTPPIRQHVVVLQAPLRSAYAAAAATDFKAVKVNQI